MMKIHTNISAINQNQWTELVDNSPIASFFQTRECYDFYASLSFLKPFVYGISENEKLVGLICGYIIADGSFAKKYLSRRAIVPGGVLLDPQITDEAVTQLLKVAKQGLKRRAIYLEIRNYNDYSNYTSAFEKAGFVYSPHLNFHVATPDLDAALKQLSTTKRRDVKLSGKAGAEWFETNDLNDVRDYYKMLSHLYKTKVKTPLFPLEFFEKLILLTNGKLFVVKHEGEIIGGSVCVLLPDRTVYEWFVCGLDGKFKNVFPSTIATWAAIEYAANNGLGRFDMMGAGKPEDGYGVRDFKSKFGGELVEHGRFITISNSLLFEIGKLGVKASRHTFKKTKKTNKSNSPYKIETKIENIDKEVWADFVIKHPNGNIFHTPQMYEVYENTPRFEPFILVAKNEKGVIVGCLMSVIQREYVGLFGEFTTRSIVFGGPLVENNNADIVGSLLSEYTKIVDSKVIYTQFRNLFDMSCFKPFFDKNGYKHEEHLDILLSLTISVDELAQNLHKERKRNIAIAEKEGLIFRVLDNDKDIADVIDILKKTYHRVKVPMSYEQLFINSKNILGANIKFFGAFHNGKMIAGQVRLCYKEMVYAWYAGSDSEYFHKRPNDFLFWKVLLWSKENGYKVFDFGGAGRPNVPYGVRDYKLKFGGELVNYGRIVKTHKPILMYFGQKVYSIYKKTN